MIPRGRWARFGLSRRLMWMGPINTLSQVAAFGIGVRWDVIGVVVCYLLSNISTFWFSFNGAMKQLGRSMSSLLPTVAMPTALALAMGAIVYCFDAGPGALIGGAAFRFGASVTIGVVSYAALVFSFSRMQFLGVVSAVRDRQPR